MAKYIKRAGIVFFALVISFLLLVSCLSVISVKGNNNFIVSTNGTISDITIKEIDEEILLNGKTCEEQATKWMEVIEKSLTGKHILVTMYEDWIAPASGILGESSMAFDRGRIYVRPNTYITIDLNGHIINRNLASPIDNGQVFVVNTANLIIKDSCYDSLAVQNAYTNSRNNDLTSYVRGKITGGNNNYTGGAIHLTDSNLIIESGAICNNISEDSGGAIQSVNSTITMMDGLIANNTSIISGGAINLIDSSRLNFYNGIVHKNICDDGGGFAVSSNSGESIMNMYGGIISKNTAKDDGGGILVASGGVLNLSGGVIEYNQATDDVQTTPCGGAICAYGASKVNITGGELKNNLSDCCGGAMYAGSTISTYISNCLIVDNVNNGNKDIVNYGGGVAIRSDNFTIGPGTKIYNNKDRGTTNSNLTLHSSYKAIISENLAKDGAVTYIGINVVTDRTTDTSLTDGYSASGNTSAPNRFFFSDVSGKVASLNSSGEVKLESTTTSLYSITWRADESMNYTTGAFLSVPYKGSAYTVRGNDTFLICNNGTSGTNINVTEPGRYLFHSNSTTARNPYFELIIEPPKAEVVKPTIKKYVLVYDENKQINFEPEGFDKTTMEISYNRTSSLGTHTAQVRLKDSWNNVWADDKTTNNVMIEYEIIQPGIVLKDSSEFDYIYLDNNYRKGYKENDLIHRVNDSEKTALESGSRYVIGNIPTNTTLSSFISNIRNESNLIKVYNNQGDKIFDGLESNGIIADSVANTLVGTGYKIELYESISTSTPWDIVYLSVLGDINGDGRITASDVAEVREVAENNALLNSMPLEKKLACMVDNKGSVTYVDSEILRNTINNQLDINLFFESGVNVDSGYKYLTLDRNSLIGNISETRTSVIGNIAVNTSVATFKREVALLAVDTSVLIIYDRKGNVITDENAIVGTGWYIAVPSARIYLSVTGDINGDGRISAVDIAYLREIATSDKTGIQDCILLSAIILNKGGITTADAEVLKCVIDNKVKIDRY